jgi:hypothetical protein
MRPKRNAVVVFAIISCVAWLLQAGAQERKGTISGHVTDASHGILQGARVQVQPTGQIAATDSQGQFTISGRAMLPIS